MDRFSPKIEIINHFDNLINRVDIDIDECLEKYNQEQTIGELKCFKTTSVKINKYKFIEVGAGFLVSTSLGILTERLASVEFNTGTTLWTIPPARAMLLGNPPCLIAFCIGSASVSLEVQIWPSSAACCFVFGSLHLFRFCPVLLSPLDELTFATSDEGLDISILVGGGRL